MTGVQTCALPIYLIVKSVKANMFPFYIEGEDDDFSELNLSNEKAG